MLTEYLSRGLTDYWAGQPSEAKALQLQETLRHRRAIERATGILMTAHDLGPSEAADPLALRADRDGLAVHRAATAIIEEHTAGLGPPSTS